jgi:hypothetical protein
MHLHRRTIAYLILLLSVTLLVTRIAGMHLHLCFDGMEPPVSLHLLDVDPHATDEQAHDDRNVELPGATVAKASSWLVDALFLVAAFSCLLLLSDSRRQPLSVFPLAPFLESTRLLRPPLRGPPVFLPR